MEFRHVTDAPEQVSCDLLAFTTFGDPSKDATFKAIDKVLGGGLAEAAKGESFAGKPQQSLSFWSGGAIGARRILVIGLGGKGDATIVALRDVGAQIAQFANKVGAASVAYVLPLSGPREAHAVQHTVEGVGMGSYRFNRYLTSEDSRRTPTLESFGLLSDGKSKKRSAAQARGFDAAVARGQAVAAAVCRARDLVNEPPAAMTPTALAAEAEAIAKRHASVTVQVLGPKKCEQLGMGMFLAVARGSDEEPRLVHMVYKPKKKAKKRVALIGKGLTFDSGGYSLKTSQGMEDMKIDMAGAAAVIAAMDAIATLGSDHEVHVIAACCENLVSGRAYKLGDVLKSMDGTTVEINNTDAEGRLTLGDAITYARAKVEPDEMFDFATLTGACMVALGPHTAGVMSDHEPLVKAWLAAAARSGEDMWRLPLNPRLRDQLKSPIADLRNTGERFGGAITAGLFLKVFAKETPWVHVDLAGPASVSGSRPAVPRGGTGFAAATIIEYLTGG